MSRHHKRAGQKPGSTPGTGTPVQEVERLLQAGRGKEAFKQAKVLFNQVPSPENRNLVERTYLARLQGLTQGGMLEAGKEVAASMLEFGVSNVDVLKELIPLLPALGMAEKAMSLQEKFASPELTASLSLKIADQAVLRPDSVPAGMTALREEATAVRSALAALDADDETRAMELLQAIPRSSPLADWRLFVRGLAAFRRKDVAQAQANWERLDQQRAAHKIARKLLGSVDATGKNQSAHLGALETQEFGEPVLERLGQLQQALEAGRWDRVQQLIGPLRRTLHRANPLWAQRLTEIVLGPLANELGRKAFQKAEQMLDTFKGILEPLPWDPKWNRFEAILWEGPQGSTDEAMLFWEKYAADLESVPSAFGVNSRQIQAIVWRRIGDMAASLEEDDEYEEDDPWDHDDSELYYDDEDEPDDEVGVIDDDDEKKNEFPEGGPGFARAARAFEQSLKLDPKQRKTYELLTEFYLSNDAVPKAVETLQKLLEAFPDDIKALKRLMNHHIKMDDPASVLEYVNRLRKLKPLDPEIENNLRWSHLALARHLAVKRQFSEGREHFAIVEASQNDPTEEYRYLSRRAAFEFRAGQKEQAEEYVRRAESQAIERAPLWMSLAIEMARYQVDKPILKRFNDLLSVELKKKVTAAAAGKLAALLYTYVSFEIEYLYRSKHVTSVVAYLKRTLRTKYEEKQLRSVVEFLSELDNEHSLLEKLVTRGEKLFPKSPYFLLSAVSIELEQDFFFDGFAPIQAKLDLALAEAQVHEPTLVPMIKESISKLHDLREMKVDMPFGHDRSRPRRGPAGPMPTSFDELAEMMAQEMRAHGIDPNNLPFDMFMPPPNRGKEKK
ncbi:hypothetical protein BH10PLA2_BH10PLA2_24790 [soil metagenome]